MNTASLLARGAAALTAALIVAGTATAAQAAPAAAHQPAARPLARHGVEITGIYYNSPGPDRGSNASLNHEWVALRNVTGHRVRVTGWRLRDRAGHVFRFGTLTLRAHAQVKVHTGRGRRSRRNRYWGQRWYIWNNDGDTATLRTAGGRFADRCSYSDPDENSSFVSC
jgi:hypothetical protein